MAQMFPTVENIRHHQLAILQQEAILQQADPQREHRLRLELRRQSLAHDPLALPHLLVEHHHHPAAPLHLVANRHEEETTRIGDFHLERMFLMVNDSCLRPDQDLVHPAQLDAQ